MKRLLFLFSIFFISVPAFACLDCNGNSSATNGTFTGVVTVGSMTSYGTITSSNGFVGDGSKLTNVSLSGASITVSNLTVTSSMTSINGVIWGFPSAQGGSSQNLANDGFGNLYWENIGKPFNIVIGTLTALKVDIASNTSDGLSQAITQLCGSSNTATCSPGGSIFYRPGIYDFQNSTIPSNVKVFALDNSSTVWRLANTSAPCVTVYGSLEGINLDAAEKGFTTAMVDLKTNSTMERVKFSNLNNPIAGSLAAAFSVTRSSNVVVRRFSISNYTPIAGVSQTGDRGIMWRVADSTEILIVDSLSDKFNPGTATAGLSISVMRSDRVTIKNNIFKGGRFFASFNDAISRLNFSNNTVQITTAVATGAKTGVIAIGAFDALSTNCSSSTISHNIILDYSTGSVSAASHIFEVANQAGNFTFSIQFDGNEVWNFSGGNSSAVVFDIADSAVQKTLLLNNRVYNYSTFISDLGTNTAYTTNDNFKDGVEQ